MPDKVWNPTEPEASDDAANVIKLERPVANLQHDSKEAYAALLKFISERADPDSEVDAMPPDQLFSDQGADQ